MNEQIQGKTILVTGGAGSIGRELVREILRHEPHAVRVLDSHEGSLYELGQQLQGEEHVRYLLGDVRDSSRLRRAFEGVQVVYHTAAYKHVPILEYNPFEAVSTNVNGTQNVVDVAFEQAVERVILISTDKAVNPINTMGATKLLAEKIIIDANYYRGSKATKFSCVRFGNVANSDGSAIPLFIRQIQRGGPVTITDKEMTRFMMSVGQAVRLIIKATALMQGGEIFILKMKAMRILDLASVLVEELAPRYGFIPEEVGIVSVGIRPGERIHEALLSREESEHVFEQEDMLVALPPADVPRTLIDPRRLAIARAIDERTYTSNSVLMDRDAIRAVLRESGVL